MDHFAIVFVLFVSKSYKLCHQILMKRVHTNRQNNTSVFSSIMFETF